MSSIRNPLRAALSAAAAPMFAAACALALGLTPPGAAVAAPDKAVKSAKTAKSGAQELGTGIEPNAKRLEELDPAAFDRSENIDHAWWPMRPGWQSVLEGWAEEDGKRTKHRIVFTVTDLVKVIGGVRARVIYDADYSSGKLAEQELTFFAQDKVGNIWHLGQYREVFEEEFVGGRIWHVGNPEGAKAGIMMPADPKPGSPSFSQGFAPPPFNWTDRGRVYQTGQKAKVPAGSYDDVLVIEEFDAEHPGTFQLKYYARGVGNIRVGARGARGGSVENLQLVSYSQLGDKELADIRAKALELEKRAGMYPAQPALEHIPVAK